VQDVRAKKCKLVEQKLKKESKMDEQKNVRWSGKKMYDGRAKVKQKMQDGRAKKCSMVEQKFKIK
jgi:hypothetical protein